jgi:chlorobactene glucosyltransferase
MNWLLLTFLPLRLVYLSPWLSFVAANGQFMLFQRYAYNAIGGHVAVADRLVEDMELARAVKLKGLRVMTVLGGEGIFCRMYDSFRGALAGFTKNFYPGFNVNPAAFVLMLLFFFSVFLAPVIMTIWDARYAACIVLLASQRIMLSVLGRQNAAWNVLLHPFQMCVMLVTGIVSIWKTKHKTVIWKGRWVLQK